MKESDIIFLGVCERAAYVKDGNTGLKKWNIIGLKNIVFSYFYPRFIGDYHFGFAVSSSVIGQSLTINITTDTGEQVGKFFISLDESIPNTENHLLRHSGPPVLVPEYGHIVLFTSIKNTRILIQNPGIYYINICNNDSVISIGSVIFEVIDPPPLMTPRITAIRSDPNAIKSARMELGCRHCNDTYKIYVAIERDQELEANGLNWYEEISDYFACSCNSTAIDLRTLRRNAHGILGRRNIKMRTLEIEPLYEYSAVRTIRDNYAELLDLAPSEESLQKFINENPILLHQFPSILIFPKAPILNLHITDFAILTPRKELILIEIERSDTKLLKQDGGTSAKLTHALDQVRDWLHMISEQRLMPLLPVRSTCCRSWAVCL